MLDISTLVRQITGRIRNSKYANNVKMFLNTNTHRYAGITKEEFDFKIIENTKIGKRKMELIDQLKTDLDLEVEKRSYSENKYSSFYVNYKNQKFFFDENLKKRDIYNYMLINEIYNNSISVLSEIERNNMEVSIITKSNWATSLLKKDEYSYEELEELLKNECKKRNKTFNGNFISEYFEIESKTRRMRNGKRSMYYKFKNNTLP